MSEPTILEMAKTALRLSNTTFDAEVTSLIGAAEKDLELVGIVLPETITSDDLIVRAIITYCRANFGSPSDYDRLKASYDEQKSQLITASGYGLAETT